MSDERRIHVLINDDKSLAWLKNQKNMSASIRLLIRQIANSGNMDDYVMHCAEQAPSPFDQSTIKQPTPVQATIVDEVPTIEPEVEDEVKDPIVIEQPKEESLPIIEDEVVEDDGITEEVIVNEPPVLDDLTDDTYWEQEEEEKQSRISRMMRDLEKKQNSN